MLGVGTLSVTLSVGTLSVMLGILTLPVCHGKHEGGVHMRVEGVLKWRGYKSPQSRGGKVKEKERLYNRGEGRTKSGYITGEKAGQRAAI